MTENRGQRTEAFEFGIRNAEFGNVKEDRKGMTENRGQKTEDR